MKKYLQTVIFIIAVSLMICCKPTPGGTSAANNLEDTSNVIPLEEAELHLFDGKTFNGWHLYNLPSQDIKSWTVFDSTLVCLGATADATGADLVTDHDYENFILTWEWKTEKGSNSGVLYHVIEDPRYKSTYETGPEYQLIDDVGFPEPLENWQKAGADYAMHPASSLKKLKPVGEWNSCKIICNNGHIEHWLNGEKIVEFDAWTKDWNDLVKAGKWKDYPAYGRSKIGKIALQDHGDKTYFRNIIIKVL